MIEGEGAPIPLDHLPLELAEGVELELHRGGQSALLVADRRAVRRGSVSVMSKPTLWHIEISHFNEKARWALDHKGVEYERRAPTPGRAHTPSPCG